MNNNNDLPEQDPDFGFTGKSGLGKQNVFKTPDAYFDKLPLEISDKIQARKSVDQGVLAPVFSRMQLVAFALVVIAVISGSVFYLYQNKEENKSESTLSYQDLINTDIVTEMDENMLLDAYAEEGIATNVNQNEKETSPMEDYLIENHTDITLIINEL